MKRTLRNLLLLSVVTVINILLYFYASGSSSFLWKSTNNAPKLQEIIRKHNSPITEKQNQTSKENSVKVDGGVDPGPIYKLNPENIDSNEVRKELKIIETHNHKVNLSKEDNKEVIPVLVNDIKEDVVPVKPDNAVENPVVFQVDQELLAVSQGNHIFPHNFKFVMNHPEACHNADGSRKDIFLAVLICTIHKNFEQRKAIRETWASIGEVNEKKIITIFLLAKTEDNNLQTMVEEENKQFKDLIMEDFQDTYKNLTLKTMMGMKWASMYCANAKYVMKTDDDMYVNYPNIVNYLSSHPETQRGLAMGFLINGSPIRDPKSKWYMPRDIYPGNRYPPFLSGTGYVMSADVVRNTYIASVDMQFLYLEDVFCATVWDKIGVKPKRHAEFHNWRTAYSFCRYKRILTTHMVPPGEMRRIWNDQKTRKTKCSWIIHQLGMSVDQGPILKKVFIHTLSNEIQ